MKSIGDILRGDGSNGGLRHTTTTGVTYTVGPAQDPNVPSGSTYVSVSTPDGGKQTVVVGPSGQVVKQA